MTQVSVGGDLVWSKLEQGRVPQPKELIPLIMVIYDTHDVYDDDDDDDNDKYPDNDDEKQSHTQY